MARSDDSSPTPAPAWRRYLIVGAVLLVLVVAAIVLFWPRIQFQLRIGELHSDSPEVNTAARKALTQDANPDVNEWLVAVLRDADRSFAVRLQVGDVLLARNRLNLVERALLAPDPAERTASLAVLFGQANKHGPEWFQRSYVDRGEYPVLETLEAWLKREGDASRREAVNLAASLGLEELAPLVRPIVEAAAAGTLAANEEGALKAAAKALVQFGDCETVPALLALATSARDDLVRLRMLQALHSATAAPNAPCADTVPAEAVKQALFDAVESGPPNTRHGALLILQREPKWAAEAAPQVRKVLDGATGDTVYIRRAALEALAAQEGDAFARELPRYFHSDADVIRSSAVASSTEIAEQDDAPLRYESCWIGLLRDERAERDTAYAAAVSALRGAAGRWVGLPEGLSESSRAGREAIAAIRQEMYERGESRGISRDAWAEAWLRWFAAELGLSPQAVEDAVEVRDAFWAKAEAGDLEGAKQALDAFSSPVPDLFLYERGWLSARGG